jgi:hypothetical protein
MLINNLKIIFIESEIFSHKGVVVKDIENMEFIVPLLEGDICDVCESLKSMEEHTKSNYNYLFVCKTTNRYGLVYCEDPMTRWELLRNNE